MFRTASGWVISPTDLVDTMECDHRSALKTALAAGVPGAPTPSDIDPLVARQGDAHERAELERLRELFGDGVVCIENPEANDAAMRAAAEATARAMRDGAPVIYQGCFYEPLVPGIAFHGRADFLISTGVDPLTGLDRPDDPTPGGYEPWDTKLARHPGPSAILQLSAYADALGRAIDVRPEHMYLVTGDQRRHVHRVAEFTPILGSVRERLVERLRTAPVLPDPGWGEPRSGCDRCGYAAWCGGGREGARHLSLVAGIRTDQTRKLADSGIVTIDALACAGDDDRPAMLPRHSYDRLRSQAALQVRQDATRSADNPTGRVIAEVYADDGLESLPAPSPGDVFFDMEGYPYFEGEGGRGLEYLFGATTYGDLADGAPAADLEVPPWEIEDTGGPAAAPTPPPAAPDTAPGATTDAEEHFHAFWAHDRAQEKAAFEAFVDFTVGRITADPDAHVYHYASYEVDRLKLLAAAFGTRETEVDVLLRDRRLVDLFTVVKKSLRVSQRSYSIKYLEPLYLDGGRGGEVTTATSSIDAYAEFMSATAIGDHERARKVLDDIGAYNRDDCMSTARLRDWLEQRRDERGITARPYGNGELVAEDESERAAEARRRKEEAEERLRRITDPLLDGVPADPQERDPAQQARALLAALAGYYRREENPSWWEYFRRVSAPMEELEADNGCLVPVRVRAGEWQEPEGRRRKARRELEARADPARPHPFALNDSVRLLYPGPPGQPAITVNATVEKASSQRITLVETADPGDAYSRVPVAVLPGAPVKAAPKDTALLTLTEKAVEALPALPESAGVDVLRRIPPRLRSGGALPSAAEQGGDLVATVIAAVDDLDSSYLAVQGPPGAGKTYLAARLITHLVRSGRSVAVCSTSHKAIENVLAAAMKAGHLAGTEIPCAKRPSGKPDPKVKWEQPKTIPNLLAWRACQDGGHLVGGTAWNFANEAINSDPFDVLIIDEAGQFALADTLAVSAAARNLVLLGDPQQLPQVVQGTHGDGAAASALEHLVGGEEIIDPALGYFLDQTRRMHPAVCDPVSRLSYRGLLHAHPSAAERTMSGIEPGLHGVPVPHTGRTTHSPEEVEAVVALAAGLIGRSFHEPGATVDREITGEDILVVAPYNLQVRALRQALEDAGLGDVRAGTVDRFQGQEAPAVICSMTVSSAAEAARGLDFVLSRNRLNVALSRAQVFAALVYAPGLLSAAPRSVAELRVLAGFAGLCGDARPWRP